MAISKVTVSGVDIFTESGTSPDIEIDYTTLVDRAADALESLAVSNAAMAASLATIATKLTSIESHQATMKTLAEGKGIHIISPYEWLNYSTLYRLLVEQGQALNATETVSAAEQTKALGVLKTYLEKISNLPTSF